MGTAPSSAGPLLAPMRPPSRLSTLSPYLFAAPAVLVLLAFVYWPILYSVVLSLHRFEFMRPPRFDGLGNYARLWADPDFLNAVEVTVVFTVASVPIRLLIALALAQLLAAERPFNRVARAVFFVPVVSSTVAIAVVWSWLFNTDAGLVNALFTAAGLPQQNWLYNPSTAIWAIVVVNIWKQLGYDLVIYIAGLQAIPHAYYEAARIDGAGSWTLFRTITLPLLMPTTFFLLVISVIDSFQVFTLVNVMTDGRPALATDVIVNFFYRISFVFVDFGRGSAVAVMLFVLLMVLTVIQFRVIGRRVNYDLY